MAGKGKRGTPGGAGGAWDRYKAEVVPALLQRWKELGIYPSDLKSQKGGAEMRGPCPLHAGDNDQAFDLDPKTLQWCCHTKCDAGGGPIEYLERRDNISRDEARNALALMVGVDLSGAPADAPSEPLDEEAVAKAWSTWCKARKLDRQALGDFWQCVLLVHYKRPAVTYPTPGGERVRYLDSGKPKYRWRGGEKAVPGWYGLAESLPLLEIGGRIYVCNGEPSVWACLQCGVPATCLAFGEGTVPSSALALELAQALEEHGVTRAAVVLDLDKVGRTSAPKWLDSLRGAEIDAVALELPATLGAKADVDDLHRKVGDAGLAAALASLPAMRGEPVVVANFVAPDEDTRLEVSQSEIVSAVHRATGGWPRAFGSLLFAADPIPSGQLPTTDAIRFLDGNGAEPKLFTWLRRHARVEWCGREVDAADRVGKRSPLARNELLKALDLEAPHRYQAVEILPHHPPRPATYYVCGDLPSGNGSALAEFMALLNPDTPEDADLLLAALVTPGWGGEPGSRPGFVLTSTHGVGSGKKATAVAISTVWGGAIRLQPDTEDWSTTAQRLLSDASLSQRMVLVDNLRGKLASGAIESAITEEVISGKRMYFGEFSRPGTMVWMLTVNVAELSRDLADRCVVIRIGPPKQEFDFRGAVAELLRTRRHELICDALAFLRSPARCAIQPANRDRFQAWQDAVLSRLPNGDTLAAEIKARRPAVDADSCEAVDVADALAAHIKRRGHCPAHSVCFVPTKQAQDLLADDLNCKSASGLTRKLKVLVQLAPLRHVTAGGHHTSYGRGLIWRGKEAPKDQPIRLVVDEERRVNCPFCSEDTGPFGVSAPSGELWA